MPKLEPYYRDLPYSYAIGLFPATACLKACPERCQRLLISSKLRMSSDVTQLLEACEEEGVRIEQADHALERISRKENCYAAMVYEKAESEFRPDCPQVMLYNPSDTGNMGTILRTALGLGFLNIAVIRPAVDSDDPRTVRASMGASFSLNIRHFDSYNTYLEEFDHLTLYPFVLHGRMTLAEACATVKKEPYALIYGNEATGLPEHFDHMETSVRIPHSKKIDSLNLAIAAGIGMYAFSQTFGEMKS